MAWLMNAWRINEDDLRIITIDYSVYSMAGRLRFVRNSSDLLANQTVEQCRFTGVRPADERNVSTSKLVNCHYYDVNRLSVKEE